jgi:[acyl-carrier-protein] S-malonyltransferase
MSDPIAFLFPGQGSQAVGMGQAWREAYPQLMALFEEANSILGYDLQTLCFEGPADQLNRTEYTQPALLVASLIAWWALDARLRPSAVAGHSLGEYSAVVAAGGLSFPDAVALVHKRARYMEGAVRSGSGLVVALLGLAGEVVKDICCEAQSVGVVAAANFNSPDQVVIAGEKAAVERAIELAKVQGCRKSIPLPVSVPVHTSLMQPAADRLAPHIHAVQLSDLTVPLFNNVEARPLVRAEEVRRSLIRQLPSSVLWEHTIRAMWEQGIRTFIEIGPGMVLTRVAKRIVPEAKLHHIQDPESLEKTLTTLRR